MIKNLTVSIVNYNAREYLIKTLESLDKSKDVDMEVFVIDNNSSDDSIKNAQKKFPKFNYILNKENLGFGKAHNLVLKNLKSEFVLILNPDVEFGPEVISKMLKFMEESLQVGVSTPEIVLPDGKIDLTAHRGLPTPLASFKYLFFKDDSLYHLSNSDFSKPHEVDAISGAFFLARCSALNKAGIFDEDYFMYAEDIDLCYRIKKAGYKIMYIPGIKVLHHKGISSGLKKHTQGSTSATAEIKKRSLDAFYNTMKIFYKKNLSANYFFLINWLVYLGINIRWFLAKRKMVV